MRTSLIIPVASVAILLCGLVSAERRPLEKPEHDTELGDTSRDIETLDPETYRSVFRDSQATATFDASKGRYDFRFKDHDGVWRTAHWLPNSNIDVTIAASVTAAQEGGFEHNYKAHVLPKSVRHLRRITLEVLSDVGEVRGLGELGSPERIRRMEAGGWAGRELSRRSGLRLWTWTRYTGNLSREEQYTSGFLNLVSKGLPSPMPCWIQGNGNHLFSPLRQKLWVGNRSIHP